MRTNPRDRIFNWRKLGVYRVTVMDTVCGYFVGWPQWRNSSRGRNIRAGLYFPTAEAAIEFRDSIEKGRAQFIEEHKRID